jgi:hypothetical protein
MRFSQGDRWSGACSRANSRAGKRITMGQFQIAIGKFAAPSWPIQARPRAAGLSGGDDFASMVEAASNRLPQPLVETTA